MSQAENQANEIITTTVTTLDSGEVIAICAVIIALIALGVSLWQGYISRRHNHLSVKPYLCTASTKASGHVISCDIINHGVGPAFISSISIACDGKDYPIDTHNDYKKLFSLVDIDLDAHDHLVYVYEKESAIAQGKEDSLFRFPKSDLDLELSKKLINVLPRFHINIEYKCIYGYTFTCSNKL